MFNFKGNCELKERNNSGKMPKVKFFLIKISILASSMDHTVHCPHFSQYVPIIPTIGFRLMKINCTTKRVNKMNCQAGDMAIC